MILEDLSLALLRYGLTFRQANNFIRKLDDKFWWTAAIDYAGYGSFGYHGRTWKAHRLVYAATHPEEDISNLFIVQSCMDHRCCDINCLHSQTERPMPCDPIEYQGKLSSKIVDRLRRLPYAQTNKCGLARTLGVSPSAVIKAMQGRTWKRQPMSPEISSAGSSKSIMRAEISTTTTLHLGVFSGARR